MVVANRINNLLRLQCISRSTYGNLRKRIFETRRANQKSFFSTPNADKNQSPYISGDTTHFGYEDVKIEEKEGRVKEVFENVAENYDIMNDVMSMGIHRYWKDELCRMTGLESIAKVIRSQPPSSSQGQQQDEPLLSILDVAGGTGDVAFRFLEACGCIERSKSSGLDPIQITVCDINPAMLQVGERRLRQNTNHGDAVLDQTQSIRFKEGNAERLPFPDNSFDFYTIAFGLRNVTNVDQALRDALRVLKPGGRFLCLEFSHLPNPTMQAIYDTYSFNVIPQMGHLISNDRDSYQYLVESIRKFSTQEELKDRMSAAGFENTSYTNFTQGIVAVHEGWKPL